MAPAGHLPQQAATASCLQIAFSVFPLCLSQEPAEEWHQEGIFSNKLPGLCLASASSSKGGYGILAASSNKTDVRVFNTLGRCAEQWARAGMRLWGRCATRPVYVAGARTLGLGCFARPQGTAAAWSLFLALDAHTRFALDSHAGSWARWTRVA